jgi:hypothetical protein
LILATLLLQINHAELPARLNAGKPVTNDEGLPARRGRP